MEVCEVQCPSCFEWFYFPLPPSGEGEGVEMDYDCEVCCRPMTVRVDGVEAMAFSLDDI